MAVWEKNKQGLPPTLLPSSLEVYLNKEAFDSRLATPPLDEESLITGLGSNKISAVWILVPTLPQSIFQQSMFIIY